jgi:hypothetical protein
MQGAGSRAVTGCHHASEHVESQTDRNYPVSGIICNLCAIAAVSRLVYGVCCTHVHCLLGGLYVSLRFNHGTVWVKYGFIHWKLCFLCKMYKGFFMVGIIYHIKKFKIKNYVS